MICRELPPCEWFRIQEMWKSQFPKDPLRAGMHVIILEEDGQICGFTTAQFVLHMEPTFILPEFRTRLNAVRMLVNKVHECFPREPICFAFTQSDRIGALMEAFGMEHLKEWRVFRWIRKEGTRV